MLPELEPGTDVVLEPEARNYVDYFQAQVPVVEDRLKRGQLKHKPLPPVLLDPRDMPEEGWQEWHDLGFYLWRMRLLVEALRGEVAKRDTRIADLEREREIAQRFFKMACAPGFDPDFDPARSYSFEENGIRYELHRGIVTATQEGRHD